MLTEGEALTFLDIIARQALHAARAAGADEQLRHPRDDSLAALAKYPGLRGRIPLDFVQHKVPKVLQDGLRPADWPQERGLEWCPPGHGDIYTALVTSGMLDALLEHGYEVAFVSNADNLGAVLDPLVLGYFVDKAAALPDGGGRPHRGRPQGRAPGAAARATGAWCCASRPSARMRTWTPSRTSSAIATSTPTTCGSTCPPARRCWPRRTAYLGCR